MLAHADIHGNYTLSFDIEKHHQQDGILEQRDEFDEYLADVQPLPPVTDEFDELLADVEPLPLPPPPRPARVQVPEDEQAAEPQLGFQPTAPAVSSKPTTACATIQPPTN